MCSLAAYGPVPGPQASHVMAMALQKVFPEAQTTIGPWIERGFYYDFDLPTPISSADLKAVKKEMVKIIKADLPFICEEARQPPPNRSGRRLPEVPRTRRADSFSACLGVSPACYLADREALQHPLPSTLDPHTLDACIVQDPHAGPPSPSARCVCYGCCAYKLPRNSGSGACCAYRLPRKVRLGSLGIPRQFRWSRGGSPARSWWRPCLP